MSINKNLLFLSHVFFQGMVVTATILKEIFRHSKGNKYGNGKNLHPCKGLGSGKLNVSRSKRLPTLELAKTPLSLLLPHSPT